MNPRSPKYPVAGSMLDINACPFIVTMEVGDHGGLHCEPFPPTHGAGSSSQQREVCVVQPWFGKMDTTVLGHESKQGYDMSPHDANSSHSLCVRLKMTSGNGEEGSLDLWLLASTLVLGFNIL